MSGKKKRKKRMRKRPEFQNDRSKTLRTFAALFDLEISFSFVATYEEVLPRGDSRRSKKNTFFFFFLRR